METTFKMEFLLSPDNIYCDVCSKATGVHLFSILVMADFIKKIALFILWLILGLTSVVLILAVLNKNLFESYSPGEVTTIFIGDSHMEMGFNDKLFP